MGITNRIRKRILSFVIVPVLAAIPLITDQFLFKLFAVLILVVYVGFIIFLRDSIKLEDFTNSKQDDYPPEPDLDPSPDAYETDRGEDFKIVSSNKDVEVITADNFSNVNTGKQKNIFKPADLKENFDKIANEDLPQGLSHDEQFGFLLEKLLNVVKEAFLANTSVFFWYNANKNKLTLEKFVSSSKDIIEQKFEIEDDVLSKIITKEEPELLTDISLNAESDVIRYYSAPQGIKSFVGVPLFYGKNIAGVLALDSKMADAFGIETIYSLGRFVRVISLIISLFDEKFEEAQSEKKLNALLGILSAEKSFETNEDLFTTLENSIKELLPWDAFTYVYFNSETQKFNTLKIVNKTSLKYVGENLEVELDETLVGKAILSGVPVKIDDTAEKEYYRFTNPEDVSFDGSFLAIPLVYNKQNYGVLCFESLKKSIYTNSDVQFMQNATKIFAYIAYSYATQEVYKNLIALDVETRALNYNSFTERVNSDMQKANEYEAHGALAVIKIDDFIEEESLFEGDPFPKVLQTINEMINNELDSFATLGRLSKKVFGVYFFNSTTKDIFLWAEKLRIRIARKPITVVSKQTTFTISVGVASTYKKATIEEVLSDAELALNKALEKGGNTVKNIN